jgi:dipeptidyl aminopeptidase/acylaminoacyl peptidase
MLLALLATGCGASSSGSDHLPRSSANVAWGAPSGERPAGVVMLLPGGGWRRPTRANFLMETRVAAAVQAGGFATVAIRYSPGAEGIKDIEGVYSKARRAFPGLPVCAVGGSAGGHWALMLAAREPDLACVVDQAGPTDLTSLATQGSDEGQALAVAAFGEKRLASLSPVDQAGRIKARVLLVYADSDPLVPLAQGEELARALPRAELIKLPPGSAPWIHSTVSAAALANATQRQSAFIQQAMAAGGR